MQYPTTTLYRLRYFNEAVAFGDPILSFYEPEPVPEVDRVRVRRGAILSIYVDNAFVTVADFRNGDLPATAGGIPLEIADDLPPHVIAVAVDVDGRELYRWETQQQPS